MSTAKEQQSNGSQPHRQQESLAVEWNIVPKMLFLGLNLMMYATHALETKYYVEECGMTEYQVGFIYSFQVIPFLAAIGLGNLADGWGAHRDMALIITALYCLINTLTCWKEVVEGRTWVMITIKTLASCFSGATFPFVDALVVGMLAQRGAFSKDSFGSQRMFGTVGHFLATALCWRFNFYLISHDGMFLLMNLSGLFFMLIILLGIPTDLKIEKGAGHHHHAPPPSSSPEKREEETVGMSHSGNMLTPEGHSATDATTASPLPTHTPSPDPTSHEQNAEACLRVAEQVQLQTSATPAPPPVHIPAPSPVIRLLQSFEFLAFLGFILTAGYSRSVMTIFQKHYVVGVLKLSESNLDFMELFRSGSEMTIYYTSRYIIAWLGPHWVLLISQTSGLLRMLIYSFYDRLFTEDTSETTKTALIVAGELLKGLNTGMMMSCAIKIANEMAPSGCEGSAQSLLSGSYNALGLTVAGVLSGIILFIFHDDASSKASMGYMFLSSSALTFVFIIAFFYKFAFYDKALFKSKE